ncbi:MAG TPA: tetratricopeptide repeat protein, partial [Bacteroidia bacterium]|nr:tetratricopeptide repeat protein [Bacteroidia bacterium]
MKKHLLFLFIFISRVLLAQNPVVDSLALLLKNAKHDTVKLRLLVELSEQCNEADILSYAKPAVQLVDDLIAKTTDNKYKDALLLKKSLALNDIGFMYSKQGLVKEALNFYTQGLKIEEKLNDKDGIATSLNNIGFIYNSQGQLLQALNYYSRGLKIQQQINDKQGIAYSLNNMGSAYNLLGQTQQALDNYYQSLKINTEIDDKRGIANALNNIGSIYRKTGQLAEALNYYTQGLKIEQQINNKPGMASALYGVGTIYLKQKNNAQALAHANQSLTLAKEIGYVERIRNAEHLLAQIDSATGNSAGAYLHYKQYIIYRDSITNTETRKASIQKQMQYEFEKKELATQAAQEKLDAIHAQAKQKQRVIMYAVVGLLLSVVIFAVFMYNRFRVTHRQKQIIEKQKVLVDEAYHELHEKNKEVMDSIRYAKRIQTALITSEKYIATSLNRLMKNNLSLLFFFIGTCMLAQNTNIDSVSALLKIDKEDTVKVIHLNQLCWEYDLISQYDKSLTYGKQGLALAQSLSFKKGMAASYNNIGNVYEKQGNYAEALKNYFASLKLREAINDKKGISVSYNNIGN